MGIPAIKLPSEFDYDLITANGTRIEVKTSSPQTRIDKRHKKQYSRIIWQFANHVCKYKGMIFKDDHKLMKVKISNRDRDCDFFVFVCLSEDKHPLKCYIIPK